MFLWMGIFASDASFPPPVEIFFLIKMNTVIFIYFYYVRYFIWPVKNYQKNIFESATSLSDDAETVFISH